MEAHQLSLVSALTELQTASLGATEHFCEPYLLGPSVSPGPEEGHFLGAEAGHGQRLDAVRRVDAATEKEKISSI